MANPAALFFFDLVILAALFWLGFLVIRVILGKVDWLTTICLSLGLGGGLLAWLLFMLSWAGVKLTAGRIFLVYMLLLLAFGIVAWRTRGSIPNEAQAVITTQTRREIWLTRGIWIVISFLILAAAILAVGLSYFGWDDISNWVVKGYGIALQGTIFAGSTWGENGLSYPMNMPLLIAIFRIFDGDLLPGSKLLYPIFYATLLIGCYRFWVLRGLERWVASLGVLLLASTPIIFTHAYMGYTNIAFTFYLVMGLVWCIDGMQAGKTREIWMGGILLAIALFTRPEGFVMCIALVVALVLARWMASSGRLRVLPLLLPLIVVGGAWSIFLKTHSTSYGQAYGLYGYAIQGILAGQIHWSAFYTIFRFIVGQVVRFRDWGFLPLLVGLMILIGLRLKDLRRNLSEAAIVCATLLIGLSLIGLHYMAAYMPGDPNFVYTWLSLEFTRLAMPAGFCFTLLGFLTIKKPAQPG